MEGMTAAVFDNLNMNVNYASFAVGGAAGRKIEMTNWATVFLPAVAMPPGFAGIDAVLGAGGIFKPDLDLEDFLDGFSMHAADIDAEPTISLEKIFGSGRQRRQHLGDRPVQFAVPTHALSFSRSHL